MRTTTTPTTRNNWRSPRSFRRVIPNGVDDRTKAVRLLSPGIGSGARRGCHRVSRRDAGEIRAISVLRLAVDGWRTPERVHEDQRLACVNGRTDGPRDNRDDEHFVTMYP